MRIRVSTIALWALYLFCLSVGATGYKDTRQAIKVEFPVHDRSVCSNQSQSQGQRQRQRQGRSSTVIINLTISTDVPALPYLASYRYFRGGRCRKSQLNNGKKRSIAINRSHSSRNSVIQRITKAVQSLFDILVSRPISTILRDKQTRKYPVFRKPSILKKNKKKQQHKQHKSQEEEHSSKHTSSPSALTSQVSALSTNVGDMGVKGANRQLPKMRVTRAPAAFKGAYVSSSQSRIINEMRRFLSDPPENCRLISGTSSTKSWTVEMIGLNGTIYSGEKYRLKLVFPSEYPVKPPSVYFLQPTPRHVHVYSNGDICLSVLGPDWRPSMSAQLVVTSILSMISSAKEKRLPEGNAMHSDNAPGGQQNEWMYHDDRC